MREALEKLRAEFFTKWLGPNGLGLLGVGDPEPDNGILFLGYFLLGCLRFTDEFLAEDAERFSQTLLKIQAHDSEGHPVPGYFHRRPDATKIKEAHDDYRAIVICSYFFGDTETLRDICDAYEESGGSINNVEPGVFDFTQMRQGSDVAIAQILLGRIPDLLNVAWLCGGLLFNSIFGDASSRNLGAITNQALAKKLTQETRLPVFYLRALALSVSFSLILAKFRPNGFTNYFVAAHPIRELWRVQ